MVTGTGWIVDVWEILPNLYLGDREDSRDRASLSGHGVTHIVNCAIELPCCFPSDFRYFTLGLEDPDRRFSSCLPSAMAFIDQGRETGGVLVHCTGGVSRSPAVVLGYLCHLGRPLHLACAELSRAVLTGIDESFLAQIAACHNTPVSREEIKVMSLVLAGRGR